MVEGCKKLAENMKLYFLTVTCRGREESNREAEEKYGERTNRLLDACRAQWKRSGGEWHYVQVTERQKRGKPHSHIITSYRPPELYLGHVYKSRRNSRGNVESVREIALRSDWLENQIVKCGLGVQYDVSIVSSAEGASRYVAKYLFKPTIFEDSWPKKWKRIRYSQKFPKQEEKESNAIVLLSLMDWVHLSYLAAVVTCPDLDVYEIVSRKMTGSDTIVRLRQEKVL